MDTSPVASCSFTLLLDQRYLIYARAGDSEGVYQTHECDRSRPRDQALEDLIKLADPIYSVANEFDSWSSVKSRFALDGSTN